MASLPVSGRAGQYGAHHSRRMARATTHAQAAADEGRRKRRRAPAGGVCRVSPARGFYAAADARHTPPAGGLALPRPARLRGPWASPARPRATPSRARRRRRATSCRNLAQAAPAIKEGGRPRAPRRGTSGPDLGGPCRARYVHSAVPAGRNGAGLTSNGGRCLSDPGRVGRSSPVAFYRCGGGAARRMG